MKNNLWLVLLGGITLLVVQCKDSNADTKPAVTKSYSIEQFYKTVNTGLADFNKEENALLIHSNSSGIYNGYSLPVNGDSMTALTHSTVESFFMVGYLADGVSYLYTADHGGDENDHIYLQSPSSQPKDLTPGAKVKAGFIQWLSPEREGFLFTSNLRDPKYFDIYEMSIKDLKTTLIFTNKDGYNVSAVSRDKKYVSLAQSITTSNSNIYVVDLESSKQKNITPHQGDQTNVPQYFSKDNTYLYYLTDDGDEFQYLVRYNLKDTIKETVYKTSWDLMYAYESDEGHFRVIGINEDGKTKIRISSLPDNKDITIEGLDNLSINNVLFSKSEKKMAFSAGSSSTPSNIYIYDFESKKTKQLTNNLSSEIEPKDLVDATVIRFKSYDGLEIPCIQWTPKQASATNKVPALVFVHGGPGGQTRQNYSSLIQYLTNQGYVVLGINNRGSSGYGKNFYKLDNQKHGDADLKDCVSSKDYLASLPYVDTSRIGIIGGSYGGYMVMAALTFAPEAFDVGVNIFGVTNWLRTLKSIPPYWESFRKALYDEMGDPYTADSVRLYKISPLFHTDQVTKPLMVLQGANDPRVLQVESDEIVAGVKRNNVPVEYVLFPDEGHGFVKKENEIKGYGQIGTFLEKYLKKQAVKN
ncbi:MAG: prolyl oligopeptidase family serine peptidase [Saprospiraceae bacterium]